MALLLYAIGISMMCVHVTSMTRHYFIASVEVEWDYAPIGRNLVNGEHSDYFNPPSEGRAGRIFKKAIFKRYTDDSFEVEIPNPPWMGIVGPVIRGEQNDILRIHYKNMASKDFSMHPHAVIYNKSSEGALYKDNTNGADKADDSVPPNGTHVYDWVVSEHSTPLENDPDCLSFTYHSHVVPYADSNAGLNGILMTCKPGTLNPDSTRKDNVKDFIVFVKIFTEISSTYVDDSLHRCLNFTLCSQYVARRDSGFTDSMNIHTINGYIFGNGPAFEACDGEKIYWHIISLGAERDVHSVVFHGQTLLYQKHRVNQFPVIPADFRSAEMIVRNSGRWMVRCQTTNHFSAGMVTFLDVQQCGNTPSIPQDSTGRHIAYYIAAVEEEWDYGPTGLNNYHGGMLDAPNSVSNKYFSVQNNFIGGKYKKAIFKAFTDASFTNVIPRQDSELHMGYLGPVIRVEVGDSVTVHFLNNAYRAYSIACSGLRVDKMNEGFLYYVNGSDEYNVPVAPGSERVYNWSVPAEVGPAEDDPDCIIQQYHSAVSVVKDVFSGLIGPILICRKGSLNENGTQMSVDKEFVLLFSVTDENLSWYIDDNINAYSSDAAMVDKSNADFQDSNQMHGINGRSYANLGGLDMCIGDTVTWHIMSAGNRINLHAVTFFGQAVSTSRNRIPSVSLLGTEFKTVTMIPDNIGSWALICNTIGHRIGGEEALFNVNRCNKSTDLSPSVNGRVRTYYIAAVEEDWDYGENDDNPNARHIEKKALYREFTDITFSTMKIRSEEEIHLGILGPFIKAEVGDVIEVIFKNEASHPYSIHADGLYYGKSDEGVGYGTDSESKADDSVLPGGYHIYHWYATPRTGPKISDPNCILWPYYSAVNPTRDTQSGLVGPIKVCRKGFLDENGMRTDVDREFVLYFTYAHEIVGWYAKTDAAYNTINGYQYYSMRGLLMTEGDRVAWYMFSLGNEQNLHPIHFHGHAFVYYSDELHRDDVINVLPGTTVSIEMIAEEPGTWLLHCHATEHLRGGMFTTYTVQEKDPNSDPMTTNTTPADPTPDQTTTPNINFAQRITTTIWFMAMHLILTYKLM